MSYVSRSLSTGRGATKVRRPAAPASLVASDGGSTTTITIGWTASTLATSYNLYRSTAALTLGSLLVSLTGTSYLDTTGVAGTIYYYTAKGVNSAGIGAASNQNSGYSDAPVTPPSPPTSVVATDGSSSTKVTISWVAGALAASYRIYRSTTSGVLGSAIGDALGTSYDDASLVIDTVYYYSVQSVNSSGVTSTISSQNSGYAATPVVTAPTTPTNLAAGDGASAVKVAVTWTAVSGAVSYTLYRSTTAGIQGAVLVSVTGTSYDDTNVVAGTVYYYSITASNTGGTSGVSAQNSGYSVAPVVPPPTGDGGPQVTLAWAVAKTPGGTNASGYKIYIGSVPGNWTRVIDVGLLLTYTINSGLTAGTNIYFCITGYDAVGAESMASGTQECWVPIAARTFHVAKTGSNTAAGTAAAPWLTIQKAHDTATTPGDTIIVHAGTYNERLVLRHGGTSEARRITYQAAYGESVILTCSASVEAYTGCWYAPAAGNVLYASEGAKNYLTFDGFSAIQADSWFFVAYAGSNNNAQYWTFKNMNIHGCRNPIFLEGKGMKILDTTFHHNADSGVWYFGGNTGGDNIELKGITSYSNNTGAMANCDGVTLQDADGCLVEDCITYGVSPGVAPPTNADYMYDGTDLGSQSDYPVGPGMTNTIIRRVKSFSNGNTNYPNSSTILGPVVFQYCTQYDNYNWGSAVTYDKSYGVVEYWNITSEDVGCAINYFDSLSPGSLKVRNSIFSLRGAGNKAYDLSGTGTLDSDYNRKSTTGLWNIGTGGTHSSTGTIGFADASHQTTRDYRLASSSACVDTGTFMLTTSAAGSATLTIPVSGDPRKYFKAGDQIQVAGAGRVFISSMTSSSITAFTAVTFASGAGVHLPWEGTAPDMGANEYTTKIERPSRPRVTNVVSV